MALLHTDSFDDRPITYIGDRYSTYSLNVSAGAAIATGRTGNGLVLSTGILDAFDYIQWQSDTTHSTLYIGVARKFSLTTALVSIRYNGTPHIYAQLNADGTISVIRFDSGSPVTTLATSSKTVPTDGTFFYVELSGKISPTAGAYELRIDGVRWLSANNINTSSDGSSLANQVRLTYNHFAIDGATTIVDDFYIADDDSRSGAAAITGFAGPVKIGLLEENANGTQVEWTPHGGTNYENVDEATGEDADTTYNSGVSHKSVDLYGLTDMEVVNPTIRGVAVHQWARKEDALYRAMEPAARVNSTDYFGTQTEMGNSYERVFYAWERNPNTNRAWTEAEVNLVQIGARANFSS